MRCATCGETLNPGETRCPTCGTAVARFVVEQAGEWVRKKLGNIIFEADTPAGKTFDVGLLICIALSVVAVMLDSVEAISRTWGGALYVFLRGVRGVADTGNGRDTGWFTDRPPRALIEALDMFFETGRVNA